MKKVLITGAAGFVGTNLSLHLIEKGYKVIGIDINDRHGRLQKLSLLNSERFFFKKLNLAKKKIQEDTELKDISAIFHLAALPHIDYSCFYPHQTIINNIETLLNTIELACILQVPLILSSSVEVYGGLQDKIYTENELPSALSPYASSKIASEAIIKAYIETQGLAATIFRFTNLYGPWQTPDRLIPRTISQILLNKGVTVEKGTERDFVFIDDACEALEKSIHIDHKGEIYNLSSGIKIDNFDAIQIITNYLPSNKITLMNPRNKDGRGKYLISSPEKLHQKIGWRVSTHLEDGIASTIKWYKANKDWLYKFEHNLSADRNSNQFLTDLDWN